MAADDYEAMSPAEQMAIMDKANRRTAFQPANNFVNRLMRKIDTLSGKEMERHRECHDLVEILKTGFGDEGYAPGETRESFLERMKISPGIRDSQLPDGDTSPSR